MFETSFVRERAVAGRRYGFLTASLAAHTLVVAGVVTASLSSVSFPRRAPNELLAFNPIPAVSIPPPLGHRDVARRPAQAAPAGSPVPVAVTAPTLVPATAAPADSAAATAPGSGSPIDTGGGTYGDPAGVPGGFDAGIAASNPAAAPDLPYAPGGDVKAATVLQRVEPEFPRAALAARMGGTVVLRCVIGRTGEIRDAAVVSSTFPLLDRAALDALRQWKFAPGSMHGKPVDTWFELTIRFAAR